MFSGFSRVVIGLLLTNFVRCHLTWDATNVPIDQNIVENALDPELCEKHVEHLNGNSLLLLRFIDAGTRLPRGILQGNNIDLGNYHQCLGIQVQLDESEIHGKYCTINVPLSQNIELPLMGLNLDDLEKESLEKEIIEYEKLNDAVKGYTGVLSNTSRLLPESPLSGTVLRLPVCIPKTCSTQQAISTLLFNLTAIGFQYEDNFCRLPNDKPWVPGDYIAVVIFSLIGLFSLLSTCYDVTHKFILNTDVKKINSLYNIFSVYTNGKRVMNFSSNADSLHCLDGIRSLAMIWVLIGHTFTSERFWTNPIEGFTWAASMESLWITSAHITVDTFFLLSGLLAVYTTAGKISGMKLIKNIHLFYLNRLLRMFPILATGVLLEATLLNHLLDGPYWDGMAALIDRCRAFWWSTLLHVQNYMNPERVCIGQSWYLAIDVQLHILSPIILFWVLSENKRRAWIALMSAFVLQLAGSTVYIFMKEFPSTMSAPGRGDEMMYYMVYYYMNTFTRASPFLVGMIFGYILHLWRGKKIRMTKTQVAANWIWATLLFFFVIYTNYPIAQSGWDNQLMDSLYNSFIRPAWALCVGWLIVACVHGYAGPINWFLSLSFWKLPARLSYAMYILHYGLMYGVNSSNTTTMNFSVSGLMFKFLAHFSLTFIVSFIAVLCIDAPCSMLFKKILDAVPKNHQTSTKDVVTQEKETNKEV